MTFRFRNFPVYKDSKLKHKELIAILNELPQKYFYIIDQARRSSLSIVLNIAEGSSKQSDKDFNRYLTIALSSIDETVACLEILLDLKLISLEQFFYFEIGYESICRQLGGFSKSLRQRSKVRS